jgi:hypothetical protein
MATKKKNDKSDKGDKDKKKKKKFVLSDKELEKAAGGNAARATQLKTATNRLATQKAGKFSAIDSVMEPVISDPQTPSRTNRGGFSGFDGGGEM